MSDFLFFVALQAALLGALAAFGCLANKMGIAFSEKWVWKVYVYSELGFVGFLVSLAFFLD